MGSAADKNAVIIKVGNVPEEVRSFSQNAIKDDRELTSHDDLIAMIREVAMLNEKLAKRVAELDDFVQTEHKSRVTDSDQLVIIQQTLERLERDGKLNEDSELVKQIKIANRLRAIEMTALGKDDLGFAYKIATGEK